jgi:transcription initiation factor TFIIA large subunit
VGSVYAQIMADVIDSSRIDFEEMGVDESTLEQLKRVSVPKQTPTSRLFSSAFAYSPSYCCLNYQGPFPSFHQNQAIVFDVGCFLRRCWASSCDEGAIVSISAGCLGLSVREGWRAPEFRGGRPCYMGLLWPLASQLRSQPNLPTQRPPIGRDISPWDPDHVVSPKRPLAQ